MKSLSVKNLAHIFGVVWLLSVVAFLVLNFVASSESGIFSQTNSTTLVIVVLTGLFAFLGAFILYMAHYLFLRKKALLGTPGSVRKGISPLFLTLLVLFLGFVGIVAVKGAYNLGQADKFLDEKTTTTEPALSPATQIKYVDSDPVTTCTSSYPNCAGQTIQARKSACSTITCCQVGDKWSVYPSENDCKVAQAAVAPTSQPQNKSATKYPACTVTYSQLGAITYYDIPPEDCATRQINARLNDVKTESHIKCIENFGGENCPLP